MNASSNDIFSRLHGLGGRIMKNNPRLCHTMRSLSINQAAGKTPTARVSHPLEVSIKDHERLADLICRLAIQQQEERPSKILQPISSISASSKICKSQIIHPDGDSHVFYCESKLPQLQSKFEKICGNNFNDQTSPVINSSPSRLLGPTFSPSGSKNTLEIKLKPKVYPDWKESQTSRNFQERFSQTDINEVGEQNDDPRQACGLTDRNIQTDNLNWLIPVPQPIKEQNRSQELKNTNISINPSASSNQTTPSFEIDIAAERNEITVVSPKPTDNSVLRQLAANLVLSVVPPYLSYGVKEETSRERPPGRSAKKRRRISRHHHKRKEAKVNRQYVPDFRSQHQLEEEGLRLSHLLNVPHRGNQLQQERMSSLSIMDQSHLTTSLDPFIYQKNLHQRSVMQRSLRLKETDHHHHPWERATVKPHLYPSEESLFSDLFFIQ